MTNQLELLITPATKRNDVNSNTSNKNTSNRNTSTAKGMNRSEARKPVLPIGKRTTPSSDSTNWRMSESTRKIGRQGLAEARAELDRVRQQQALAKTQAGETKGDQYPASRRAA